MARPARPRRSTASRPARMLFERRNYLILAASVGLIVLGFALMRIENEVDGFFSLVVGPLLLAAGYIGTALAILWRPKPTEPA